MSYLEQLCKAILDGRVYLKKQSVLGPGVSISSPHEFTRLRIVVEPESETETPNFLPF